MKRRIMMSLAVAGLLSGAALAQTTNNAGSTGTGLRAAGGGGSLGGTTFQFVPGVGFVPMTIISANSINNGFGFDNGFGFNNGLGYDSGFGFTPGFTGYYGYGPTWSGPLLDVRSAWAQGSGAGPGMRGSGWNGTGIPTLGMNVRAAGPAQRPVGRARVKLTQDSAVQQRVAGARQEARREQAADAEQVRLAANLQNLMNDRPLREGTVTSLGAKSAEVRFRAGNQVTTQRFPLGEVYFFKAGGLMATAATDPDLLGVGSQVLIPEPPRQSVAGSREESTFRNGTVTIKPATSPKAPAKKVIKRGATTRRNSR